MMPNIYNETYHVMPIRLMMDWKILSGILIYLSKFGHLDSKCRFTPWTMKSHHGRWPFPWSNWMVQPHGPISYKKQFTKPLGPSPCVNQMWIKRNDHAPKCECVIFFNICSKNGNFEKKSILTILLSSLVLIISSPINSLKLLL